VKLYRTRREARYPKDKELGSRTLWEEKKEGDSGNDRTPTRSTIWLELASRNSHSFAIKVPKPFHSTLPALQVQSPKFKLQFHQTLPHKNPKTIPQDFPFFFTVFFGGEGYYFLNLSAPSSFSYVETMAFAFNK
jgi:hypothetical protein